MTRKTIILETPFNYQILILTLLIITFCLQKGYFWAPLEMPSVPSSHCKGTDFKDHEIDGTRATVETISNVWRYHRICVF